MERIKLTAVSYLNTKPLLYGLIHHEELNNQIDIELDIPSVCADKLLQGEVHMGLVPVAAIPAIQRAYPQAQVVSDYCIGCEGKVKTVAIYSDCPIQEVEELYLDFHSRSSVQLVQVLLQKHWKLSPRLLQAEEGFIHKIKAKRAALVIGDRSIGLENRHPYSYDLGEVWKKFSGLPFVFAVWVSIVPLSENFIQAFNDALAYGIRQIPKLVYLLPRPQSTFDLKEYFSKYISYELNPKKQEA
ncbi:MAG TPA: ABC transporter substrate-binding protein, partial [Phaeodactylibacter sp.]|nr:ABC transporter substrate-binding protein [Phaeodactylibacter sp.]